MEESNIEEQAKEVDKKGFVPTKEVDFNRLPSKGKNYPNGASITIRPYSFGEVKRISDSDLSMDEKVSTIISGVNTTFDKNRLTFSDILYLGMLRKLNTIGTLKAIYPFTCPECGENNEKIFSEKDLVIEDLPAEELPIRVTMSDGKEYKFGPIDLSNIRSISKGEFNKLIPARNMLKDKLSIYSLLCKNKKFEDIYMFLNSTTDPEDHEILDEVDKLLTHDVKPLDADCASCGYHVQLPVKNGIDLVLPFRKKKRPVRSRISFGEGTELSRD